MRAGQLGAVQDYPIFMAIAEQVGFDRRNNKVYKRTPDGESILEPQVETEWIRVNGHKEQRTLHRRLPKEDNDLPEIARRYHEFRERYAEPGVPRRGPQ